MGQNDNVYIPPVSPEANHSCVQLSPVSPWANHSCVQLPPVSPVANHVEVLQTSYKTSLRFLHHINSLHTLSLSHALTCSFTQLSYGILLIIDPRANNAQFFPSFWDCG